MVVPETVGVECATIGADPGTGVGARSGGEGARKPERAIVVMAGGWPATTRALQAVRCALPCDEAGVPALRGMRQAADRPGCGEAESFERERRRGPIPPVWRGL